jgi:hypothetical protein
MCNLAPTQTIPRKISCAAFIAFALVASSAFGAGAVVHVPADQASLQVALNTVPDGGVIELAAGTYAAPAGGFTIYPDQSGGTRSFTVRAATGAAVVLSGGGSSRILTFTTPKPVTFERLTFANGVSTEQYQGGAISVSHVQASFVSCIFDKNAGNAPTTGGGAVWIDTSTVSFQGCTFTNNTSLNYAGAISALLSSIFISDSRFSGNRTNVPGQSDFNAGGAIHGNGCTMKIAHCSFDDNQAGYVGGAIYVIGLWQDPVMDLLVTDSEFTNNIAVLGPTGTKVASTTGGAVFLEAQTTARFFNCRFTNNSSQQGGAISSYQTITEVKNCVFTNNRATGSGFSDSLGGAIIALSADNPDPSLGASQPNRRPAQLTVTDSLIQGPGVSAPSARQGGGIFIAGDLNFAYGLGGAPVNGTVDSNRAVAYLTRVVFSNLATVGPDNNGGSGGALTADFATVHVNNCIVQNCSTSHFGGAFELVRRSVGDINNTTFSHNTAGSLGGAITMFGGNLNVNGSNFLDNGLNTGSAEGTVLVTSADPGGGGLPPVDMVGTISNCLFDNNSGQTTIYDGDSTTAPFNRLQYSANRIFPNDANLFRNDVAGPPANVQQLNALSIPRNDGTVTVKAPIANISLTAVEPAGAILTVPPTILQSGAPGEAVPIPSFVAFAASGGTANLDGSAQRNNADVVATSTDGPHTLKVGSLTLSTNPPPGAALNISTRLPVGNGQNVLIGGFIIQGPVPKRVMIRSVGPSLNATVSNALQDPTLELHNGTGALIGKNDNWRNTQLGGVITTDQAIEILASTIAPSSDAESAIIATLNPGNYTAIVGGANNSTGIALVEIYDLDAVQDSTLANISTRGFVQDADNVMIGGFIYLGGVGATNVVLRGIGPSLVSAGINNFLNDPVLEVHNSNGAVIASNDNWQQSPQAGAIQAAGLAPSNATESALLLTGLARGNYTAVLRGQSNGTGVGVIEAYIFP